MNTNYDVAVIGAGPAGLSAAINIIQRGKSVIVYGNTTFLSRAEKVNNYLGFYDVTGSEMMDSFTDHAIKMGVKIENKTVANILPMGDIISINASGDILNVSAIIYAGGIMKAPSFKGEDKFLGRGVSYCATCDGMFYRGKNCIVWGNAENAVEEAEFLHGVGVKVSFLAMKKPENLSDDIAFIKGSPLEIKGEMSVKTLVLKDNSEINVDGIFLLRPAIAPDKLIPGLEIQDSYIKVDRQMQTNVKGVYACGDCTGTPLQVSKAVGEGLIAGLCACEYIAKL